LNDIGGGLLDDILMLRHEFYPFRQLDCKHTKESEMLIDELKSWCEQGYGRRGEVAKDIGVSRQIVSDWLHGRALPGLDNGLALRAFLKRERRRSRS